MTQLLMMLENDSYLCGVFQVDDIVEYEYLQVVLAGFRKQSQVTTGTVSQALLNKSRKRMMKMNSLKRRKRMKMNTPKRLASVKEEDEEEMTTDVAPAEDEVTTTDVYPACLVSVKEEPAEDEDAI